jgi:uncharacterized repeat protein (TIGR01451 family)
MKNTIKQSIVVGFLLVSLAPLFVLSGCGTKTADFKITNTVDKTATSVGDTVTYTIILTNNGSINTTGVAVTDDWPVGLTYVSNNAGQGSYDSSTGIWTVGNLDTKASVRLTITAVVTPAIGVPIIDNVTRVSHVDQPNGDINTEVGVASITIQSTELAVTNTVDNAAPDELSILTYTITLTNNSQTDATNVIVADYLPQGVTYISSNADQGNYDTATHNWTVANVAKGVSLNLTIKARVNSGTGALKIDNTPILAYADQPDSNLSNNTATASVTVNGSDLSISIAEDNIQPKELGTVKYTLTLTNNGPLDDTGIIVTAVLPPGLTFVSGTTTQGSYDAVTGKWNAGSLANGVTSTLTIQVTVNAGTAKQKINYKVDITHTDKPDGSGSDNSSSTLVTISS